LSAVDGLRAANLALRFALELATLVALAYWGFQAGGSTLVHVLLGLGAPLGAALAWVSSSREGTKTGFAARSLRARARRLRLRRRSACGGGPDRAGRRLRRCGRYQ
jgi:hypothetical protein